MLITKLQIAGLRSIEQAEFTFQPGMNLIVGVNGVGKTTVLDALRICLSRILPDITASRNNKIEFEDSDIKIGAKSIQIDCEFNVEGTYYNLLIKRESQENPTLFTQKKPIIPGESNRVDEEKRREAVIRIPDIETIIPSLSLIAPIIRTSQQQPLGVYLSTRRSLIVDKEPTKSSTAGGQAAAFADSLSPNRELNLRLSTEWFDAQKKLGNEDEIRLKHIEILREAVSTFLPGFQNLDTSRIVNYKTKKEKTLLKVEKNGTSFRLDQLSDGERGILAIVLDLARRLSQANPGLEDPVKDGAAVVLIDELDLHLHPKWQRSIVENLTSTFQNCQFIVTTHSPQIIGEVKPERITIIGDSIYSPSSSFGMDSSRVLEEIMDTDSRNVKVEALLSTLSKKIDEDDLSEARELLEKLKNVLGPNDPEVTRSVTMIDFLESEIDE